MNRIISIIEVREGINESFLAVNLALSLSGRLKDKVPLINLGGRGDSELESLLGRRPSRTLAEVLPLLPRLDGHLMKGYLPEISGIPLLGEGEKGGKLPADPAQCGQLLKATAEAYPFTVVIAPREPDGCLESVIEHSDIILFTLMPHLLSVQAAASFLTTLTSWHFPLSMVKPVLLHKRSDASLTKEDVKERLGIEVFSELAYEPDLIISSVNKGTPAVLSQPRSAFSAGINTLARRFLENKAFEGIDKSERARLQTEEIETELPPVAARDEGRYSRLKETVHRRLIAELDLKKLDLKNLAGCPSGNSARNRAKEVIQGLIAEEGQDLTREERGRFVDELLDEALGLGCLENLLKDPGITEIMVNGPNNIYVERAGKIEMTGSRFTSLTQLLTVIDRIVSPLGRRVDESSPLVDARLADGSRVNAVISPVSLIGPCVTIRKFAQKKLTVDDLVRFGALKRQMGEFLGICVRLRKNIIISGGTGSGKTTLLNIISSFIPDDERIVTIEDSAELKLPQAHVVRLESRPASIEGTGEIPIRRLVINALRMRPDRIVVGECRGGETLDMLQAMNTGHDGSLTTVHANSPRDAVSRIATMVMMAGMELPEKAIREQIAAAVQVIVQLSRMSDGSRKVIDISEVRGIRNDALELAPLFKFEQTGVADGKVSGRFAATGLAPSFIGEVETHGLLFDRKIFSQGELS
ncbi:MAG: ATPase, T2SS/T4P/T4SS family [Endomicrobiales bacterium]